jgi:hypothetical protein
MQEPANEVVMQTHGIDSSESGTDVCTIFSFLNLCNRNVQGLFCSCSKL